VSFGVLILIPPEVSYILDYQVQHPDEADKETGKKKPGTGLQFLVKLVAEVAKQDNDAGKLDSKPRPFHKGLPFFAIRLVFLWGH
jgi:hypothetical protein